MLSVVFCVLLVDVVVFGWLLVVGVVFGLVIVVLIGFCDFKCVKLKKVIVN